jgi:hypothetical protein
MKVRFSMEGTSSRSDLDRWVDGFGDLLRTMFSFALLGPPIGLIGVLVASVFIVGQKALATIFALPLAIFVVGPPALATGFVFYFAKLLLGRSERAVLAAAVAGAIMTWLWFSALQLEGLGLISVVGAATAALLAGIDVRRANSGGVADRNSGSEQDPGVPDASTGFSFATAFAAAAVWSGDHGRQLGLCGVDR